MSDVLITAGVGVRIPHGPYKKDTHSGVFFYMASGLEQFF